MPYKDKEKQKQAQHQHYLNNKELYHSRATFRRKELKEKIIELKQDPCVDCNLLWPHYVMDFDHRDPFTKVGSVSRMIVDVYNLGKILEEIKKCDLVCANCHRIRTWNRAH